MPIHHVKDGKLEKYEKLSVDKEQKIEEFIEKHPKLLGEDIFIIGRQISTPIGRLDLLGLDKNGNVIIVELKKGLPSREVVSQILDYAVWGEELQYDDLNKIAKKIIWMDHWIYTKNLKKHLVKYLQHLINFNISMLFLRVLIPKQLQFVDT